MNQTRLELGDNQRTVLRVLYWVVLSVVLEHLQILGMGSHSTLGRMLDGRALGGRPCVFLNHTWNSKGE